MKLKVPIDEPAEGASLVVRGHQCPVTAGIETAELRNILAIHDGCQTALWLALEQNNLLPISKEAYRQIEHEVMEHGVSNNLRVGVNSSVTEITLSTPA